MKPPVRHVQFLVGLVLWARAFAANAEPADAVEALELCRTLAEAGSRLACYDKIELRRKSSLAGDVQGAGPSARLDAGGAFASGAARPGLPIKQPPQKVAPDDREASESKIPGLFEGWRPQTRIRLLNGQLWQINDASEGAYTLRDAKVTIERGSFGGFFMHIEGVRQTPRVRRLE